MDKLVVDFKHCFGIKSLEHEFDFSHGNAHMVYAPNGVMKSSFARIFKTLIEGGKLQDNVFPERITTCSVKDGLNNDLPITAFFVIEPHNMGYESKKVSTLLVKKELQEKYAEIHASIEQKRNDLLKALKSHTGQAKDNDILFSEAHGKAVKDFYECLVLVEAEINRDAEPLYADIVYTDIANDSVAKFLETPEIKGKVSEYIEKYNELIEKSSYFRKGVFNHSNASKISAELKKNGFFEAKHKLALFSKTDEKQDISSPQELETAIAQEKEKILTDKDLAKKFEAIDKLIKNRELDALRTILENRPDIVARLDDLKSFKKDLWISYLQQQKILYYELLKLYREGEVEIKRIVEAAKEEATEWKKVVKIFNERFNVPFEIGISNQDDVILKGEVPSTYFIYKDGDKTKVIEKGLLSNVLSTGEQRALYILNIIFEIEARKKEPHTSLLIIDDIADSFDYKNKYAIIEYLKEIIDTTHFRAVILTHNFDFFRTVASRLVNAWKNCYIAEKTEGKITLEAAKKSLDVFAEWKKDVAGVNLVKRDRVMIAAIPFIRNLFEYARGDEDDSYLKLTSLLHLKSASAIITMSDLKTLYDDVWKTNISVADCAPNSVLSLIYSLAEDCLADANDISIENKIILSIAIRLKAEEFMILKINDATVVEAIKSQQTAKLFKKYKISHITETGNIAILDQVMLMTPENIHFNSFMYEPILDMSCFHLKDLYKKVKNLSQPVASPATTHGAAKAA